MSRSNLAVVLLVTFLLMGGLAFIALDSAGAATPPLISPPCSVDRLDALKRQTEEARARWAAELSPEAHQAYASARSDFVNYALACADALSLDLRQVLEPVTQHAAPARPPSVASETRPVRQELAEQPLAPSATFGPDYFGYVFIDSDETGGPRFSFIDISGSGTPIALADDTSANVPIGFTFKFYGQSFATVNVSSNGYLKFTAGDTTLYANDCPIPDATSPDTAIYAFWDDLNPDVGGQVYRETRGTSPNRVFIVQYNQIPFRADAGSGTVTFEVLLYEGSNDILIQYLDVEGTARKTGNSATQGIESRAVLGPIGLLYKGCNAANNLKDNLAVLYTANKQADLMVTKLSAPDASVLAGETFAYTVIVDNKGTSIARYVTVADTFRSAQPFTVLSIATGGRYTCTPTPGATSPKQMFVCTRISGMGPGMQDEIIMTTRAPNEPATLSNIVEVSSPNDPVLANNTASYTMTIRGAADLVITKGATPSALVGQSITYTLIVTNTGPSAAPNVVVLDYLPTGVSSISYTPSKGSCMAGVPGEPLRPATCNMGALNSGETITIRIVVKLTSGSPGAFLFNDAQVSSDWEDPDNSDNVATARTQDAALSYLFLPLITR
jgi:uncharacterized repeat protein (TIGR01451 family)